MIYFILLIVLALWLYTASVEYQLKTHRRQWINHVTRQERLNAKFLSEAARRRGPDSFPQLGFAISEDMAARLYYTLGDNHSAPLVGRAIWE